MVSSFEADDDTTIRLALGEKNNNQPTKTKQKQLYASVRFIE